jgi:transposase
MNNGIRYVGLDVHRDSISVAVRNGQGKLIKEAVIPTSEAAILGLMKELGGMVHVVFEEGTWAAWLYELLEGRVARVVVCDPRKLDRQGNKNDRIDARELSDLLRWNRISVVYHTPKGQRGLRDLRELARTYVVLSKEQTRAMNRIKALYRSYAIPCAGLSCYGPKQREKWLAKLPHKAVQARAKVYYEQLDSLVKLRQEVRQQLLDKGKKHTAYSKLKSMPWIGPISTVLVIAFVQIPQRFRGKRQLWAYCGFALETHSSADYRWVEGQRQRSKKGPLVRGLNRNHHHLLKWIFKSAATRACSQPGPFQDFYFNLLQQGMREDMARLTVARKMVAIALLLWKKGERFNAEKLKSQAA